MTYSNRGIWHLYPEFVNGQTFHALCNCIKDTSFMTPLLCNQSSLCSQPPNILFMLQEFDNLPIRPPQTQLGVTYIAGSKGGQDGLDELLVDRRGRRRQHEFGSIRDHPLLFERVQDQGLQVLVGGRSCRHSVSTTTMEMSFLARSLALFLNLASDFPRFSSHRQNFVW